MLTDIASSIVYGVKTDKHIDKHAVCIFRDKHNDKKKSYQI